MTRREVVTLCVCMAVIGWLARDALANGQDQCTGSINGGVLGCTSNGCPGNCANSGWMQGLTGGVDVWHWDGQKWVFVQTLDHNQGSTQSCSCDGITSTCCRLVLYKDQNGVVSTGTYGGCVDDCTPPMHDPCHPEGNPTLGAVEAKCRP
jgi:hypothetical protein